MLSEKKKKVHIIGDAMILHYLILVFLNDKIYKISINYWIIVLPNFNFIVIPFSYQRSNFFHDTMKYEYPQKKIMKERVTRAVYMYQLKILYMYYGKNIIKK